MYYKKGTQILLVFMIIFMIMGSALNNSIMNNLNSTEGNTTSDKSSIDQNIINKSSLTGALENENIDTSTKISETYEFLKSKLYSFAQKSENVIVSNSDFETDDKIVKKITIRAENETHVEEMTFTVKMDKEHYAGPLNEDVDFLLTPEDVEHHSAMTFLPIIMGFQWGWWYHYEWEYKISRFIWNWEIVIFRAYFEISFGAIFRFYMPIAITVDIPDEIQTGQDNPINLTLTALDLKYPNGQEYYEFVIGAGLVLKAGAYILGATVFDYSIDLGWFEYESYTTPLYPNFLVYPEPIRIGLISLAANIAPAWLKPILEFISDNLLDASIFIYPGIGSDSVTAQVNVFGIGVTIGNGGPTSTQVEWNEDGETVTINLYSEVVTNIVLSLSFFTIHINHFVLSFYFALDYEWLIEWILGDYTEWHIGDWWIATGFDILDLYSSQVIFIPICITQAPPAYSVEFVSITPSEQSVEAGGTTSYTLEIKNKGTNIDTFKLSVVPESSEIDPNWATFLPAFITLNPEETKTVEMTIYAPRHYTTPAGDYAFTIKATSQGDPSADPASDVKSGVIKILPFYDLAVRRISQLETGVITITCEEADIVDFQVQNLGNAEEKFLLSVSSDLCTDCFAFPASITLPPGETATVQVEITPPFVHSAFYEAILIGTSDKDELIQDDGKIIIQVLPTCDSVIYFLNILRGELYNIPYEVWMHPSSPLRKAMDKMINEVIIKISGCSPTLYGEAYDVLLRNIKPKLTGLKTDEEEIPWDGGIFNQPWIIDDIYQEILTNACNLLLNDIKILFELST